MPGLKKGVIGLVLGVSAFISTQAWGAVTISFTATDGTNGWGTSLPASRSGLLACGGREGLTLGGDDGERLPDRLELDHLHRVAADVEPDGLNL